MKRPESPAQFGNNVSYIQLLTEVVKTLQALFAIHIKTLRMRVSLHWQEKASPLELITRAERLAGWDPDEISDLGRLVPYNYKRFIEKVAWIIVKKGPAYVRPNTKQVKQVLGFSNANVYMAATENNWPHYKLDDILADAEERAAQLNVTFESSFIE